MVFTIFDRSALYQIIHDGKHHYYRHEYEPPTIASALAGTPDIWNNYENILKGVSLSNTGAAGAVSAGKYLPDSTTTLTSGNATGVGSVDSIKTTAEYLDQIMPFDITLAAQNEYGLSAWMAIIGVEILNEGGGLSVDDITNEEQCTYVCRGKTPWIPWTRNEFNATGTTTQGESSIKVLGYQGTGATDSQVMDAGDLTTVYGIKA